MELNKIIWAVDIFCETPDLLAQTARALRALCGDSETEIEPVYVRRPVEFVLMPTTLVAKESVLAYEAEKKFRGVLTYSPLFASKILPLQYLTADGDSLRMAVKTLIEYGSQKQADLIALCTHARKGMPRLFMGSFAESLVLQSPIPVLVTNPSVRLTAESLENILFPTDFSEKSRWAYDQVVHLAKQRGANLILFHKFEYPYHETAYPFVPPVSLPAISEAIEVRKEQGEQWTSYAQGQGVKTKFLQAKHQADVVSAIIKTANKLHAGVIAMASQTGPILSAILGSTTRQVIRRAGCPVLVIHPDRKTVTQEHPVAA